MKKFKCLLIVISLIIAFSAVDSFGQKNSKADKSKEIVKKEQHKLLLKKNARKNGYKITVEGNITYFEAVKVEDPATKKLLEGLKELGYRCRKDEPLTTTLLTFSAGNSQRVRVSCPVLIEPQIILLGEPE